MELRKAIKNLMPYGYVDKHLVHKARFGTEARQIPELYNKKGDKVNFCYLQDTMCDFTPYSLVLGRIPEKIVWDRFNQGLEVHFYTHREMKKTSDLCERKYGILRESEAIVPQDYAWALQNEAIISDFHKVFTHSARVLNRYENAVFAPANGVWYGTAQNGGNMLDAENYQKKTKNISMVSSDKVMCEMHKQRIEIAKRYAGSGMVDVYGKVCGNYVKQKADALQPYRYSIAVENDTTPYYFTEKLLDCLAAMTIPVYVGATELDKFFNMDGIIQMNGKSLEEWDKVLHSCCKEDYQERLEAVRDNYNRVFQYLCIENYITDHYSV